MYRIAIKFRMTMAPNPRILAGGPPPYPACVPMQEQPKVLNYERIQRIGLQNIVTGIMQIIIGLLCIIFNIVALRFPVDHSLAFVGHGIWCGVLFIVTGGFGIRAGKNKRKGQIIAYAVLCIISAIFAIVLVVIASAGAISASFCDYRGGGCGTQDIYRGMEAAMVSLAIAEGIIASIPCCASGICCYTNRNSTTVIPRRYYPNSGQVIYNNQTQVGQHAYLTQLVMDPSGSASPPPPYVPTYKQSECSNPQRPYSQSDLSNLQRPYAQYDWSSPRRPYTPSDWSSPPPQPQPQPQTIYRFHFGMV